MGRSTAKAATSSGPELRNDTSSPPGSDFVVEAEQMSVAYGERVVLHDITTRIPRRLVTCIIGGSGCGKSTLLRGVIGLVGIRSGRVRLLGEDLAKFEGDERARLLARVGFMFQYGALLNSISVFENLAIPLKAHTELPADVIEQIIHSKLRQVGLGHAARLLPGELSGGMRKRAGFARAMILDPEMILCDEPSAGLDPVTAANLDELLLELKEQLDTTLVVVTHELASIRVIADRIVMLDGGRIRFDGPLSEADASSDPVLRAFFDRKEDSSGGGATTLLQRLQSPTGAEA
ncbi:MAG: ATP-binding cassette domain-containing protein [Myxococcota bacterium]|jgi:phospholipid/cholesterol/gamma-HCH transport system ATP-binding protein|nr:ATP-binding cassette domain-containing protein [Myxococcota bacterium]